MASATAIRYSLSRGLLGLKYDQIKDSDSDSERNMFEKHLQTERDNGDVTEILVIMITP